MIPLHCDEGLRVVLLTPLTSIGGAGGSRTPVRKHSTFELFTSVSCFMVRQPRATGAASTTTHIFNRRVETCFPLLVSTPPGYAQSPCRGTVESL